jgi:hypothetical protein
MNNKVASAGLLVVMLALGMTIISSNMMCYSCLSRLACVDICWTHWVSLSVSIIAVILGVIGLFFQPRKSAIVVLILGLMVFVWSFFVAVIGPALY